MPEIRMLKLTDITAPTGEVCGPDGCYDDAAPGIDPAAIDLGLLGPGAFGSGAPHAEIVFETPVPALTASFGVIGMTCGHCVSAVTKGLTGLPGVDSVDVDLIVGGVSTVTVGSDAPLGADAVRAAIEEAGYVLA